MDAQTPPPTIPTTPPQEDPPQQNLHWLRSLSIGLGVLSLGIAIAVGGYIYTTSKNKPAQTSTIITSLSPTPTVNWKTYTDINYHFSFKYPPNWIVDGNKIEEKDKNIFAQKGVSMEVYENAGNLTALEFLDTLYYKDWDLVDGQKILKDAYMKQYRENINKNLTTRNGKVIYVSEGGDRPYIKSITVNGKPATLIEELVQPRGTDGIGAWIPIGENGLLLRGYPVENEQEVFDQILSTFKFTNQTQAPTSSPATYVCPSTNIDCMPIVEDFRKWQCESTYLEWVGKNCPGIVVVW